MMEEMLSAAGVGFTFGGEGGLSLADTSTNMRGLNCLLSTRGGRGGGAALPHWEQVSPALVNEHRQTTEVAHIITGAQRAAGGGATEVNVHAHTVSSSEGTSE
jgi:hypothetical protein